MLPFSCVLGEAFTGYIQRLSDEKTANPMALWRHGLHNQTRYPQSNESAILDHNPFSIIDIEKLALTTGLTKNQIEQLTLLQLTRTLVGNSDFDCSKSRILSGELATTRRFCPFCLKEKGYYQLLWQIHEIQVCLRHQTVLLDKCPSCDKPVYCLFPWARVGYCQCGYDLKSFTKLKPVQSCEADKHERIWCDWQQLMDSFMAPNVNDLGRKRSLAIAIMYVANDFKSRFEGIDGITSELNRATISSLLQAVRGSETTDTLIHVRTLLTVLREKGLSVTEFARLQVPDSFVTSIYDRPVAPIQRHSCIAPWCKSFGSGGSLLKTGTSAKTKIDGSRLKYYFYCQDCGIEYAINEQGQVVERGYFIELGWQKVRQLVLTDMSRREIARKLNVTVDQVIRCTAFMAANGLISKEAKSRFLGKPEDKKFLDKILTLIKSGVHIKTIHRDLKLAYHVFLYYRYKVETIRVLNSVIEPRKARTNPGENEIKTLAVLKEMVNHDEKITIELVAQKLGVCHETLRYWGVLPLIAKYKEQQQKELDKKYIRELKIGARTVIGRFAASGEQVTSERVYKELAVKRNVLVRNFPGVTKYIASLLKKQRDKEHQARVKQYISIAKTLIYDAQDCGGKTTVEDIADALELSVAGVSRYPQILQLLREGK